MPARTLGVIKQAGARGNGHVNEDVALILRQDPRGQLIRPRYFLVLIALAVPWAAAGLTATPRLSADAAATGSVSGRDRTVVLLSLDGFPAKAFEEPRLPAPTLRRLAREGAVAGSMTVPTPAVTWPVHTTFVTGLPPARHGVLFNGRLVRDGSRLPPRIEPWIDKQELVRVPTVYDIAHRAGLTTAEVDWVAIHKAATITWAFPERPDPDGRVEKEMVAKGRSSREDLVEFSRSSAAWRDEQRAEAAVHIIETHRPNLLLLHFLVLDGSQHQYGPGSPAAYTAIAYLDTLVRRIVDALVRSGRPSTLLIVSDHGFKLARRQVQPNALLRREGLLKVDADGLSGDAYVVSEGGTAMVYVTRATERPRVVPILQQLFGSAEGIERVLTPSDYPELGLPSPEANDQAGDLILVARDGHVFGNGHEGDPVKALDPARGYHGQLGSDPEMGALFVAWGHGIRPGSRLPAISSFDVAPTIAALLGLRMDEAAGRPLTGILETACCPSK